MSTRPEWQALLQLEARNQVAADRGKISEQYRDPANDPAEPGHRRQIWAGAAGDLASRSAADGYRPGRCRSGIEAKTVNAQLAPAIAELQRKLPAGYTIEAAGTVE